MTYKNVDNRWLKLATTDGMIGQLVSMNEHIIEGAFYGGLGFGTGGLCGVIGVGTNRTNVYTVAMITQGLSNYVKRKYKNRKVVGIAKLQSIIKDIRRNFDDFGGVKVSEDVDYNIGVSELPESDVVKLSLEGDCTMIVRTSGTEPKMKLYFSVNSEKKEEAVRIEERNITQFRKYLLTHGVTYVTNI